MKLVSTALLAAGLVALSACGGGATENVAVNNSGEELYNLTEEDLGTDNLSANEATGNEAEADANASTESGENAASENASGNSQ